MPRKPRVEYEGAIYHVMARGNGGQAIVKVEHDRDWFVQTLGEAVIRAGWRLHAFVLMRNHYHLLIETPSANLVEGMRWLQTAWTARYNARNHHIGHLFQGRYKAVPVEGSDGYFLSAANYIHLNPARAGLINLEKGDLESYRWSSYPAYHTKAKAEWLCRDGVLADLGVSDGASGRLAYRRMIKRLLLEMRHAEEPWKVDAAWERMREGWHFGSEEFAAKVLDRIESTIGGNKQAASFSGTEVEVCRQAAAERKLAAWMKALKLEESALAGLQKGDWRKAVLAYQLKSKTIMQNRWIAERLGTGHPANLPRLVQQVQMASKKPPYAKALKMLRCED